jgi:hypothetical protein
MARALGAHLEAEARALKTAAGELIGVRSVTAFSDLTGTAAVLTPLQIFQADASIAHSTSANITTGCDKQPRVRHSTTWHSAVNIIVFKPVRESDKKP